MVGHVYLLDTNVLLAALLDPDRLPQAVATGLSDSFNTVYFSKAIQQIRSPCATPTNGEVILDYILSYSLATFTLILVILFLFA